MSWHTTAPIILVPLLNACGGAIAPWGDGETGSLGGSMNATGGTGTAVGGATSTSVASSSGAPSGPVSAEQLNLATAVCGAKPWILSGLVPNSRDLGGVPIANGAVSCDRLYRGSQLNAMGAQGCTEFASLGIRTVIDLRTVSEAGVAPSPSCVEQQANRVFAPMPTPYGLSAQDYIADLHAHESLLSVFAALGDASAYPVYFHCIYGRDRTGVLAALILRLLGASREVVMTEYMRTVESGLSAAPNSLEATLNEIDRLGGAEAFLTSIGVLVESLEVLRTQASLAGSTGSI